MPALTVVADIEPVGGLNEAPARDDFQEDSRQLDAWRSLGCNKIAAKRQLKSFVGINQVWSFITGGNGNDPGRSQYDGPDFPVGGNLEHRLQGHPTASIGPR
jgi:hypothetical protein